MAIKEWMIANPKLSVVVISFIITLIMTLVTKYFTNQGRMKEIKESQKSKQEMMKSHREKGEYDKMMAIQKEIMAESMELMKHSFKPMFITFIPLIIIFWWIRHIYVLTAIASTWIWWYIITGIVSSIILRKILKVV